MLTTGQDPSPTLANPEKGYITASQRLAHLRTPEGFTSGSSCVLPLYPKLLEVSDLENLRNKYALRLHKGLAEQVIAHKHARALYLWLEIKPLFLSGVIFSDAGKFPYKKIAEFVGEGISTIRKKIVVLKRMKLLRFDREKNLHLASYKRLQEIFNHTTKRKYKLLNNGETQFTVKQVAIYENLKRQDYTIEKKILQRELRKLLENRLLDPINSTQRYNFKDCEQYFSRNFLRKFKKHVHLRMDVLKQQYEDLYDHQVLQIELGFPEINPDATLSTKGIARVLNRRSQSSGHYQTLQLEKRGLMRSTRMYAEIKQNSPAEWEQMLGIRTDIYSYKFPTRINRKTGETMCGYKTVERSTVDLRGNVRLHFRTLPNRLKIYEDALFY